MTQETCTYQRWEKESRYYEARVHKDLWGDWVVTRVWGQRGSKRGRIMNTPCTSYSDALKTLEQIQKRRKSHQYRPITGCP